MLYNNIMNSIKESMKSKDTHRRDVLKQVQTKAQAFAKENKCDITDEIVMDSIRKELKQLNQTLEAIKSKPESDLYKSTTYKIEVLTEYLPKQLNKQECLNAVQSAIDNAGEVANAKSLIGIVMKELKGKADNKLIKECFDEVVNR